MAAAHGALTGRPAVVVVTRAVGAANLAIALHAAHADSAPLIAHRRPGRAAIAGPRGVPGGRHRGDVRRALPLGPRGARRRRAAGRARRGAPARRRRAAPDPVLLSLPAGPPRRARARRRRADRHGHGPRPVARARAGPDHRPADPAPAARRASGPLILAGAGVLRSRATADLVRFAEMLDVPVVAAWRRPDVFPNDHALYLGMSGYFSAPTVAPAPARGRRASWCSAVASTRSRPTAGRSRRRALAGPTSTSSPSARGPASGAPTIALAADARTFVREARRLLGGGGPGDGVAGAAPGGQCGRPGRLPGGSRRGRGRRGTGRASIPAA